jgi:leucyl/phenylalanyl-tRNA--protein transferase
MGEGQQSDLVGIGLDLEPPTLLAAYRAGMFPMRLSGRRGPLGWWSPDPRGVLPLENLKVSKSLRQSCRRLYASLDTDFDGVVAGCADRRRPGGWIGRDFRAAYRRMFELGHAHSVEVRDDAGVLVGGLYGVAIGGFFSGESMFSRATDASKVALVHLVEVLSASSPDTPPAVSPPRLLDVQWTTPHLVSLGAVDVSRERYLALLAGALAGPPPPAIGGARTVPGVVPRA